jgi:triacylglycerol lipase
MESQLVTCRFLFLVGWSLAVAAGCEGSGATSEPQGAESVAAGGVAGAAGAAATAGASADARGFAGAAEAGVASFDSGGAEAGGGSADGSADGSPVPDAASPEAAGPTDAAAGGAHTVLLITGTLITGDYFDTMGKRLEADGFAPVVFVPPDLFTHSLVEGAGRIAEAVGKVLAKSGEPKLHIVAECNGGVAARYYVQFLDGAKRVDRFVTMVSAHHGTYTSPLGSWVTGYDSLEEIKPGSSFLDKLNSVPLPPGLPTTSIYTCNDEVMMPYTTSRIPGAENVQFCAHYVGHFGVFWDELVYARIVAALRGNPNGMANSF